MRYSINGLLIISAVLARLCFPTNSMPAETAGEHISIAVIVKEPPVSIAAGDSFILAQESRDKEPLLRMVAIRARSSSEVKQLRQMNLDIVMVKPAPDCPPGEALFSGRVIVEAVVSAGQLSKLKKLGFELYEMPEKK